MTEKSFSIKVPVYSTEIFENPNDVFGGITYSNMISFLKRKIDLYKDAGVSSSFGNKNKTKMSVISEIDYKEITIGEVPTLFLRISAYSTNLIDGYLEPKSDERIEFERDYKIGSENNFILIYPIIVGLDSNKYKNHFLIFVYEDPDKNGDELRKITKLILNKILQTPIANLKLPSILNELVGLNSVPELKIKYSSINYDDNEVDVKYHEYFVDGKFRKSKERKFENMPFDMVEELLNESSEEFQKTEAKLIIGKKEYRLLKELINEAEEEYRETGEKIYNYKTTVTESELKEIYNQDFIISRLEAVIKNYLSVNDGL